MDQSAKTGRERRQGQWFWRRLMIMTLTVFSMTMLVWLAWHAPDDEIHRLMVQGYFWLLFGLTLLYVAGATTQDIVSLVSAVKGGGTITTRERSVEVHTSDKSKAT